MPSSHNTHFGDKEEQTRNQYASPPPGNAIPASPLSNFFCQN